MCWDFDQPHYKPALHDVVLDHFSMPTSMFLIVEIYILLLSLSFLTLLVLHKHRFVIIRRIIVCFAVLYLMRGLFLITTQLSLPYSTDQCPNYKHMNGGMLYLRALKYVLSMGVSSFGPWSCGDLIFSGHTSFVIMVTIFIIYYAGLHVLMNFFFLLLSTVCSVLIILSTGHYTIDVMVGYMVATWIFASYHMFIKFETLKYEVCDYVSMATTMESLRRLLIFCNFTSFLFESGSREFKNEFVDVPKCIKRIKSALRGGRQ
ncbi:putative phosphatidylcholine:ceramide cholinephosphotransferase 3 [Thelohanellus kitauei]|uniref:Putative phosphatidylcholine:ceramide cholinephosphotransferase 3 n=1 Tax=Thelohanellus kitauei TaxID=669202 RepID=A0A0C2J585_THEKT|nr:putative phosphatidylcholine:ceramide cholinephosphotransferase 3 [Thelohanellus kitauei]